MTDNTNTYLPLISLTNDEMKYVENKWHHAVLSLMNVLPTFNNRYNDVALQESEIHYIIRLYGIKPPVDHWYWSN